MCSTSFWKTSPILTVSPSHYYRTATSFGHSCIDVRSGIGQHGFSNVGTILPERSTHPTFHTPPNRNRHPRTKEPPWTKQLASAMTERFKYIYHEDLRRTTYCWYSTYLNLYLRIRKMAGDKSNVFFEITIAGTLPIIPPKYFQCRRM